VGAAGEWAADLVAHVGNAACGLDRCLHALNDSSGPTDRRAVGADCPCPVGDNGTMDKKYDDNPQAYVAESPIHGKGLFARIDLATDDYIGTYEGPDTLEDGMHVLWLWNEDNERWEGIDGKNEMRFLNHARPPNAEWYDNDLYALREIEAGEEITFDYGEDWED
jgi:hypothetical protein